MAADDSAGAFLNGTPIGHTVQQAPPHGAAATTPTLFSVAGGAPFQAGVNVLQIVVLDQHLTDTGVDFQATVTAGSCPHWYSDEKLIAEGQEEPVATSSSSLTLAPIEVDESEETCQVKDKETIENPSGGGAGKDEITEFKLSNCYIPTGVGRTNAAICNSGTPEVVANGLVAVAPVPAPRHPRM